MLVALLAAVGCGNSGGGATKEVSAIWALESVSADRTVVVIKVAGGGCLTYDHSNVTDDGRLRLDAINRVPTGPDVACTADLTGSQQHVRLPRPLRADERPLGECTASGEDAESNICRILQRMGRQPSPTDLPSPPPK